MKKIIALFSLVCLTQINLQAQTNHPTIDTIEVSYMSAPGGQVIPEATIHMKTWTGITKVFYQVIDTDNTATVYSVNYTLADLPVNGANSTALCLKTTEVIQILNATATDLKTYTYQVQTQDSQGTMSPVYSLVKTLEP